MRKTIELFFCFVYDIFLSKTGTLKKDETKNVLSELLSND